MWKFNRFGLLVAEDGATAWPATPQTAPLRASPAHGAPWADGAAAAARPLFAR